MIIHMVTAAKGAKSFYGSKTNKHRSEDQQDAIDLDEKTLRQWMYHPNLHIVDNNVPSFNQKLQRVVTAITSLVKSSQPQFVFKFLVEGEFDVTKLEENYKFYSYTDRICFLITNNIDTTRSIGKRVYKKNVFPTYFQVKRNFTDKLHSRVEKQRILSRETYYDLLLLKDPSKNDIKREVIKILETSGDSYIVFYIETTFIDDQ